ncbi:glutathione S-transferase family protein [Kiloniella antarctica]|uniref:glutathione transferase n=1 Tax=Kiloniella antarctica TaxID=1550907 RepID=A0ABW5BIZ7_9PROT
MERVIVYGAEFSVYVQAVLLTLIQKDIAYELVNVNPFQIGGPEKDHLARNPFGYIPAFDDGKVRLYEAEAIARYIDEAYLGPELMPLQPEGRAYANQILSILNSYAYPNWVRTLYIETITKPKRGETPNHAAIEKALPIARITLSEISRLKQIGGGGFLTGATVTLPDLFCAPMYATLCDTLEGAELVKKQPALQEWWRHMEQLEKIQEIII